MARDTTLTFALSPEQRAVPGAEQRALFVGEVAGDVQEERVRLAVAEALRAHDILNVAIDHVPGLRGLRLRYLDGEAFLKWQSVDLAQQTPQELAAWLQAFNCEPLAMERGELVSACLARLEAGRHQLVLSVNALVADRQGLIALFGQIAEAYVGVAQVDPEDAFQYADFVDWRLEIRDEAPDGGTYWDRYVKQVKAQEPLHWLQRRVAPASLQVRRISACLPLERSVSSGVAAGAKALGGSPEAFLQAAWWLLLSRLTGSSDFVGGWQHDCRGDYAPMEHALGVFDKVLPIAVHIDPEAPFAAWAHALQQTQSLHIDTQELWAIEAPPLEEHLALGFVFHDQPPVHVGPVQWSVAQCPGPMLCFELALQVAWSPQGASLSLRADGTRHKAPALERLLLQFEALLIGLLEQPTAPVGTLPLVGAKEHALLLAQSDVRLDVGDLSVAEHVARWARKTPDAPAVQAKGRVLNYGELERQVVWLAAWLMARGVAAGDRVAIHLGRSIELPMAMLAIWRVGAAYVPLEPAWPEARRAEVLADARPALVLDGLPPDLESVPVAATAGYPRAGDMAYVLYTSGSTGTPKGVPIRHGQLLNYVAAASEAMELDKCRRWALTSSVVADLGNTALFGALYNGACLVIADEEDVKDAEAFARFLAEGEVDAIKIVPSHLEALLEGASLTIPATVVLGGEAAPRSLIEKMRRLAPGCAVYNHYGPTEATVGIMVHPVALEEEIPDQLPLSKVLANNRVYVLDSQLRLVPAGCMGEVFIGGAQVCHGYLNRTAATAFVADPFHPGERMYRTGDLAHVLPGGGVRLAGRSDHQVKVRGFRVEPAEIEVALLAQSGVRQAVVLGQPSTSGATVLKAFCVVDEGVTAEAVRTQLRTSLPEHMVPATLSLVASFARLPNGKIDRHSLERIASSVTEVRSTAEPGSALENLLCSTMAAVLGRESMGLGEDFFEAGGHSLLVIKIVARIRKHLHIEVSAGLVFDAATPRALAQALHERSSDALQLESLAKSLSESLFASTPQGSSRQQEEAVV